MKPNDAAIVIAFMQITGIVIMGLIVDRVGRRILMKISCCGSSVFLIIFAVYCHRNEQGHELAKYNWIPVVLMSLILLSQALGISSIPFIMIQELVPFNVCRTFFKASLNF